MIRNANNQLLTITLLGAGAIGQLWLSQILKHDLTLNSHAKISAQVWLKADSLALNQDCATRDFRFEFSSLIETSTNTVKQSEIFNCPANDYKMLTQSDVLLVCLKSHQIVNALAQLQPYLSPKTDILLLHNGMGVIETINAKLAGCQNRFFQGITTQAAFQYAPNKTMLARQNDKQNLPLRRTVHTANGLTQIGPVKLVLNHESESPIQPISPINTSNQPPIWFNALAEVLPPVVWNLDIHRAQWQKLAINAMINPLTVKYRCLNGELAQHSSELMGLAEELAELFVQLKLSTDEIAITANQLFKTAQTVIEQTANNRSSMLQDVLACRKTEIASITGFILQHAQQIGLELPNHTALYEFVINLQTKYS